MAICTIYTAQGQNFFNTDCRTKIPVTQNCPATYDAEIIVTGLPPLGTNNLES